MEQKVSAKAIKYFNSDVVKFNNRIENMLMVKPVNAFAFYCFFIRVKTVSINESAIEQGFLVQDKLSR